MPGSGTSIRPSSSRPKPPELTYPAATPGVRPTTMVLSPRGGRRDQATDAIAALVTTTGPRLGRGAACRRFHPRSDQVPIDRSVSMPPRAPAGRGLRRPRSSVSRARPRSGSGQSSNWRIDRSDLGVTSPVPPGRREWPGCCPGVSLLEKGVRRARRALPRIRRSELECPRSAHGAARP